MTTSDAKRLFEEFPPVSTAEWMAAIEKDLKGASFEKALMWKGFEGITLKPFYRREDLQELGDLLAAQPAEFPYVRGVADEGELWTAYQEIVEPDPKAANAKAKDALGKGVDAAAFRSDPVPGGVLGVAPQTEADMAALLDGLECEVRLQGGALTPALFELVSPERAAGLRGALDYDPIADALLGLRPYPGAGALLDEAAQFGAAAQKKAPNMVPVNVRASVYHESGGSAVQELAFALAAGVEYVAKLGPEAPIGFEFAVGSSFFVEIAKLRAARLLWANALSAFGVPPEKAKAPLFARTSNWNKTVYDPYVNMLRATTEAMSAVIGGADALAVAPFDATFKQPDEFSERIARNVQNLLREETYIGKVKDIAGGSYFIEVLTDALAREAWKLFQKVEANGGMLKAIEAGLVQEEIRAVREAKDAHVAQRRLTLLGTNQYPNLKETMLDKIDLPKPVPTSLRVRGEGGATVETIRPYRAAEPYEKIRLATEKSGKRPKIYLLTIGNLAMRKARANFISNFFGCAGFEIVEGPGTLELEAAVQEAAKANPDAIVLCSSDEEYAELGPKFCELAKREAPNAKRVLAGYPKDIVDALKEAGMQDFVHIRSNALETLAKYQEELCK